MYGGPASAILQGAYMSSIIPEDKEYTFPHFTVLKASAGSGKTYTLTERFAQFVLSEEIKKNRLKNILAITFSNNAAKEMKGRILKWLKDLHFEDPDAIAELGAVISMDSASLKLKADQLLNEILENYPDFQVMTIDSFMASIFKASAIDFGYDPDFEILMSKSSFMEYAFDLFMRDIKEGSKEAEFVEDVVDKIGFDRDSDSAYLWDPSKKLLAEIEKLYGRLSALGKEPIIEDCTAEQEDIKPAIIKLIQNIEALIEEAGLVVKKTSSYYKSNLPDLIRKGRFNDLMDKGLNALPVNNLGPKASDAEKQAHAEVISLWAEFGAQINGYISCHVRSFYGPYLSVFEAFRTSLEEAKKRQGKVFIDDINSKLAGYLDGNIVPDVYFRLGETVYHFLIDEFQDTSPIQWRNLFPLMENSLAQNGSVFIVGDTKQAIYRFRNSDYTIMKSCEEKNPFPSAAHEVQELQTNHRSDEKILQFNEKVFKEVVVNNQKCSAAAAESGLGTYIQHVKEARKGLGYAEVKILPLNDEDPPERLELQQTISCLIERGYRPGDIAVLTQKNEHAIRASSWLNEKGIDFISMSSLDIRRRKITGEIVSILNFLDSPTDDLAFAGFIMGDLFAAFLAKDYPENEKDGIRRFIFRHRSSSSPLYKSFQKDYADLWQACFSGLFKSTGYLPLYDLLTELYSAFRVFETMQDEEATLVKILESVKDFEGDGRNSLRDFLSVADDEDDDPRWNLSVPEDKDAVKIMTIHKSKGLGFPVVIALLYEKKLRNDNCIIIPSADEQTVRLLRINDKTSDSHPDFEALYEEEKKKNLVDHLNGLYVDFTRPKEELYVIGVKKVEDETTKKKDKKKEDSLDFPFKLLPVDEYKPADQPEHKAAVRTHEAHGIAPVYHHRQLQFEEHKTDMISVQERQRGEFIHKVLSQIKFIEDLKDADLSDIITAANTENGSAWPEDRIRKTINDIIGTEDIRDWFIHKEGREIKNEKEFLAQSGELCRMDRVVMDTNSVTVIDYKTGRDNKETNKHAEQMQKYMEILKEIYPDKAVKGLLIYTDTGRVTKLK